MKFFGRHLGFFEISLISCLRAEIQRLLSRFLGKFYNFRFGGRHIGILDDDGHARIKPSHSPDIFRKSHQRISVYYMWFRNGSEKIGLGGNFNPPVKL